MLTWRDLNQAELETCSSIQNPTTFSAANGEVQTKEESKSVRLRLFVTVLIFDVTLAALSLGNSY